jgi:hypothetical protein
MLDYKQTGTSAYMFFYKSTRYGRETRLKKFYKPFPSRFNSIIHLRQSNSSLLLSLSVEFIQHRLINVRVWLTVNDAAQAHWIRSSW